ncbi:MAG TPA: GNAT family N-acetyltransferase [Thermoplasmata archaeon]|nr:GNAT family N-acetyltransferase [Thermoplasmata archaeon]
MERRSECGRCGTSLGEDASAYVCAKDSTFCPTCYRRLRYLCPDCGGELVRRPKPGPAPSVAFGSLPPSDPRIVVRRAAHDEWEAIGPLFDAYRQFYEQPSDREASAQFLHDRLSRDESVVFVAELGGSLAGFLQLYPLFSSVSLGRVYLLNDLFVDPAYRRHGVGRRLLESAREFGESEGAHYLELSTAVDNPAQRLYEACGWVGDREFLYYELPLARPVP